MIETSTIIKTIGKRGRYVQTAGTKNFTLKNLIQNATRFNLREDAYNYLLKMGCNLQQFIVIDIHE